MIFSMPSTTSSKCPFAFVLKVIETASAASRTSLCLAASLRMCAAAWRVRRCCSWSRSCKKLPCDLKDEDMVSRASSLVRMAMAFSMLAISSERRRLRSFHSSFFVA